MVEKQRGLKLLVQNVGQGPCPVFGVAAISWPCSHVQYRSATKTDESVSFAEKWMDLETNGVK